MVVERFKDLVSGMVRVVEAKVRAFAERPKRKDRVAIGAVLTDMVSDCLMRYGLEEQIEHDETAPVDFLWSCLSFGWECKRFVKTEFRNDGHAIAWLKREVIDRFREQERIIGKSIKYRGLVVNEKRWGGEADHWLAVKGIDLCEVGRLDCRINIVCAELVFCAWFEDMVCRICNEGNKQFLSISYLFKPELGLFCGVE